MMLSRDELLKAKIEALKEAGRPTDDYEAKLAELIAENKGTLPSGGRSELQAVEEFLNEHFTIVDWEGVRIVFGAATALYVNGEMLWVRLVGASRSGKTEMLRAIACHTDTKQMEVLTPAAIRGGLKEQRVKLLRELDGQRVVTYDMAALLTARPDMRNEVFGLLRLVKDGRVVSDFGSPEGHLELDTKFDWIAATTPYFEQSRVMEGLLGERFIDLWWLTADREEMAIKAAENNPDLPEIREQLASLVGEMLDTAKAESENLDASAVDNAWLGKVANIAALLRTPIAKDYKGHISAIPEPEVGTDLAQGFQKIALGLQLLGVRDFRPYITRLARDCVPSIRRKLLAELVGKPATADELAKGTALPKSTVQYHLNDLKALKVVAILGNTYTYRLKASLAEEIGSIWKQ